MRKAGRIPVPEAAKRALLSEETIRLWCRKKRVRAVRYSVHWWIEEDSLAEVLQGVFNP
jgi:hypothetical protein